MDMNIRKGIPVRYKKHSHMRKNTGGLETTIRYKYRI